MKVVLFNPPPIQQSYIQLENCCWGPRGVPNLPSELIDIGSNIRKHCTGLLDAGMYKMGYPQIFEFLKNYTPDALVFQMAIQYSPLQVQIINICKQLKIKCIGIGVPPYFAHQMIDMYPDLHFAIYSEPAKVLKDYVSRKSLKNINGIVYRDKKGKKIVNKPNKTYIDQLPKQDFSLFQSLDALKNYSYVLQISDGCPYKCSFCTWANKPMRYRNVENTIQDLKTLEYHKKGNMSVFLLCSQITNKKWLEKFIQMKEEEKLKFTYMTDIRANEVTEDNIEAMMQSGCIMGYMGVESCSQPILDAINKNLKLDQIELAIDICVRKKFPIKTPFLFNLSSDPKLSKYEDPEKYYKFIKKTKLKKGNISSGICKIYPGTEMANKMPRDHEWVQDMGCVAIPTHKGVNEATKKLEKFRKLIG